MFDAHIRYYAYDNLEGDEFGVGYLGNKEWWIDIINRWNKNEGDKNVFTIEDWDELDVTHDFRGIQIAEVVPDGDDLIVTYSKNDVDDSVRINKKHEVSWEENNTGSTIIPRWISRLKTTIRESEK